MFRRLCFTVATTVLVVACGGKGVDNIPTGVVLPDPNQQATPTPAPSFAFGSYEPAPGSIWGTEAKDFLWHTVGAKANDLFRIAAQYEGGYVEGAVAVRYTARNVDGKTVNGLVYYFKPRADHRTERFRFIAEASSYGGVVAMTDWYLPVPGPS